MVVCNWELRREDCELMANSGYVEKLRHKKKDRSIKRKGRKRRGRKRKSRGIPRSITGKQFNL